MSTDLNSDYSGLFSSSSEFRSSVKVEVAVLGSRSNEPYGFCGRKATPDHWSQFVPNMSTDILGCSDVMSEDMKLEIYIIINFVLFVYIIIAAMCRRCQSSEAV